MTIGRDDRSPRPADVLRIGVITAIPTPYRDPFWDLVATQPKTALKVYYCSATNADRPWNPSWQMRYENEILPGYNLTAAFPSRGACFWNPAIGRRLRKERHDALIVGGYNYPTMIAAMWHARRLGIPYFLMSESHLREPRVAWRRICKDPVVRTIVTKAAGCLPTGAWAREYLLHYGARPDRLWFMPNVPDVEVLDRRAQELAKRRPELRAQLGLGDWPTALYMGRLVEFKRVDVLLQAFVNVAAHSSARLVIVGDGLERSRLETLAQRLGLADRVLFKGFVEPADVPLWYAAADVMALPSAGETWSVAVLEALASGLPVVTTDTVGAAADAITDPVVGTVVPTGDVNALAEAIAARLTVPTDRRVVRERWAPFRDRYRYDIQAHDIVAAIRQVVTILRTGRAV